METTTTVQGGASGPDAQRIARAAWAFSTRRVPPGAATAVLRGTDPPRAGDLVLARVDSLGQHPGLQLPCGRRKQLFPGDEIVVAYGNRYASNQFEALVPDTVGPCHLAAGGGIAARVVSWHVRMTKGPTQLTPIGLLGDGSGRPLNLASFGLEPISHARADWPTTIAVVGTGMDSGKTQTCAFIVRGLAAAGLRVGYAKVTGTGAGGDYWMLTDAGAAHVVDFTDAGMATTYLAEPQEIDAALVTLMGTLAQRKVDAIVVEIADGVLQRETAALLRSPVFGGLVGGVVMASQDSMGASAGVQWLRRHSRPRVLAISGLISASPLQAREAVEDLALPVHDREGLGTPSNALALLASARQHIRRIRSRSPWPNGGSLHVPRPPAGDRTVVQRNFVVASAAAPSTDASR